MSAEIEPIRGLPEALPPGEAILWQGSPRWQRLAVTAFHVRKVGFYFLALALWRLASGVADRDTPTTIATSLLLLVAIAAAAMALLTGLAWLSAKATVYTVTSRRVVLRFGVALPLTVNVPYRIVRSVDLRLDRDGCGDIPLALLGDDKIAYLALWPHARPWRLARPEPMLRAVPEAIAVADLLSDALQAQAERPAAMRATSQPEAEIAAAAA